MLVIVMMQKVKCLICGKEFVTRMIVSRKLGVATAEREVCRMCQNAERHRQHIGDVGTERARIAQKTLNTAGE